MSEQNTEPATPPAETAPPTWDESFKGEDPAKVRKALDHAREWEKRAKENADAAKRLAAIEESQKSETEKAADRIAKADAEVASVPAKVADALRTHLVGLHEINAEDAELFLTATEPDLLLKQVARLLTRSDEQTAARKKVGNHVPSEGKNPPSGGGGDDRAFARQLFGSTD